MSDTMSEEELEKATAPDFDKQANKNTRHPISDNPDLDLKQRGRMALGAHKRLDADFYMHKHTGMKFMWINDMDGDVQRWIEIGATPVAAVNKGSRHFKGLTDKNDGEWVRSIGGTDEGGRPFYVYLLMMDEDEYEEVKIKPLKERQAEINAALHRSGDHSDVSPHVAGYGDVQTYNPNLPTGDRGFHEEKETIGPGKRD